MTPILPFGHPFPIKGQGDSNEPKKSPYKRKDVTSSLAPLRGKGARRAGKGACGLSTSKTPSPLSFPLPLDT